MAASHDEGATIMADEFRSFLEKMISEAGEWDPGPVVRIPRPAKTRQMNVKVTEDFHARVRLLASKLSMSMTDLIGRTIDALEESSSHD